MAIESKKIVTVKSLPGQVLQELPATDTREADGIKVFAGGSGKKYEDIGGRLVNTSIAEIRALKAGEENANLTYLTTDYGVPGQWVVDTDDTTSADNTGTVLVTNGGIRVKRKYDGGKHLLWFGCKGDGVTDDSDNFQKAISSLVDGEALIIDDKKTFRVTKTLIFNNKKNIKVNGKGTILLDRPAVLDFLIKVTSCDGAQFSEFTIDGLSKSPMGIKFENSSYLYIDFNIKNIGDGERLARGIVIAPGCNHSKVFCNASNIIADDVSRAISISNASNTNSFSFDIDVSGCIIENVQPFSNGDGIVVDQDGYDCNIRIFNNIFKDCYKRSVKLLSSGCEVFSNAIILNDLSEHSFSSIASLRGDNIIHDNKIFTYGKSCYENTILIGGNNVRCYNNIAFISSEATFQSSDGVVVDSPLTTNMMDIEIYSNKIYNVRHGISLGSNLTSLKGLTVHDNKIKCTINVINVGPPVSNFSIGLNRAVDTQFSNFIQGGPLTNGTVFNNYSDKEINSFIAGAFDRSVEVRGNTTIAGGSINEQVAGRMLMYLTQAPSSGAHKRGDIVYNTQPGEDTPMGWLCIADGSPGTWRQFGENNHIRTIVASDAQEEIDDLVIIDATSTDVVFTLLPASQKKKIKVKNKTSSTKTVTVKGDGTTNIDDSNIFVIAAGNTIEITSDGAQYYITGQYIR